MSTAGDNLVKEAWALSKTNVEQWEKFLTALDNYTWDIVERSIRAPTVELQVTVGMARQALEFLQTMRALDALHEKLKR
jgi:hypothetical protein